MKKLAPFVVAVVLGGCFVVYKQPPPKRVAGVAVPNVVGMPLAAARTTLQAGGLRLGPVRYAPGAAGAVIKQSPAPGVTLAAGAAVYLTVGAAQPAPPPLAAVVPQVTGLRLEDARRAIEAAGLKVGRIDFFSSPTARDRTVVSQSPSGGAAVERGAQLQLRVSLREERVAVPNVIGMSLAEASAVVVGAGLTVGAVESVNIPGVPAGNVASQRPFAGSTTRPGSAVSLKISTGVTTSVVPNVVGLGLPEATRMLTAAGLSVAGVASRPSTLPDGTIVGQNPVVGTLVRRGSGVSLVLSGGRRQVAVPPVAGLTLARAEETLRASSLKPGKVLRMPGRGRRGTVTAQSPQAGALVHEGSEVALTVSSGPAQVLTTVPAVIGLTQLQATRTLAAAGLRTGAVTAQPGPNVGRVVSQSPAAGSKVAQGAAVEMVVATKMIPGMVVVPNVVGAKRQSALRTLAAVGLTGRMKLAPGKKDTVLSQNPAAGATVRVRSTVLLTVGSGVAVGVVTVPNVMGMKRQAAEARLRAGKLVVGEISTRAGGRKDVVASQNPAAGTRLPSGSQVSLVLWAGAAGKVAVPNLVRMERNVALRSLRAVGLAGQTRRAPGERNVVLRQSPAPGTMVAAGSTVVLTVGTGRVREEVSVPSVIGMKRQAAEARLRAAGLVVGEISTRAGGRKDVVASQNPGAGTRVPKGSQVSLVLWAGGVGGAGKVSVPNVVGRTLVEAQTALKAAGLVVGRVERRAGGVAGQVMEQRPTGASEVRPGSRVDLVVGAEVTGVRVPQLVGMNLNQAQARLRQAGLTPGNVTRLPGGRKDRVASQSSRAGTLVAPGSKVDLTVYAGAGGARVPSVVGKSQQEAQTALREAGYKPQVRPVKWGRRGVVASQDPAAGTAAEAGTTVVIYVGR